MIELKNESYELMMHTDSGCPRLCQQPVGEPIKVAEGSYESWL